MSRELKVYNSLSRQKEVFKPIQEGRIGMYVCGPTVYSAVHLGNVRTFTGFDVIYRYLLHSGYKVRYVRNITDVGHLLDDGEDRMSKGARLEQLEPMEIAQKYTLGFHEVMNTMNALPPSIEPRATGHILGQIEMVQDILDRGFAYETNGSVYFDVPKFIEEYKNYGQLSGRKVDELLTETRDLKSQSEKRHPADFAIWMKASEDHIMRWKSPWSVGFPGWHLECSVMSTKYLGESFDIHGGGNDLKFPHHENEIAQNIGACGHAPAHYWLHTNMLLMNGRKMSKSDGNTISPEELFTGNSPHVSKGYSPMVVRFFMMQSHYRSTMDLTDEALQAAEKGYMRLMEASRHLQKLEATVEKGTKDAEVQALIEGAYAEMDDDFNTPKTLAKLFEMVSVINSVKDGHLGADALGKELLNNLQKTFHGLVVEVMGLKDDTLGEDGQNAEVMDGLMNLIIELRKEARTDKNWSMADKIRDELNALHIVLKDGKEGTDWTIG